MNTATDTGADFEVNSPLSEGDAAEVFLKRFMPDADDDQLPGDDEDNKRKQTASEDDGDEPSKKDTDDNSADDDEDQPEKSDETDDEEDESEGKDDKKKRKFADAEEDVFVKVKIGEEEHEVPVKDLKRLYGQEASITKKSMEVAERRKALDGEFAKASTATAALLERAKSRFEPYSKIDFALAAKELSAEEYQALRSETLKSYEDVQFLEQSLSGLMTDIQKKQEADLVTAARESLKILSGPVEGGGIQGWGEKLYDDIRAFAITEGAPAEIVNKLVDPWAVRLLHDAMLYKRGQSKVITKKVNKTPKKVIKTTITHTPGSKRGADSTDKAMKTLRQTGSTDAAADVFLSRWAANASDDD